MQEDDSIEHHIRQSVLGSGLDTQDINSLASIAEQSSFLAGRVLFIEGGAANALSVVCSGRVALDMHVPLRGNVRILTLGAGDLLGWSALVGDGIMSATATVLEDAVLLNLPKASLRRLCDADHTLGYAVMNLVARALAQRLQGARLQMLDLFSETLPTQSHPAGSGRK